MKKILFIGIVAMILMMPAIVKAEGLTSLKVKGIDAELSTQKTWKLTYTQPAGQNYMIVVAETSDPSYTVEGAGKVELQEGDNTAIVTVKDSGGQVIDTYTLNVKFSNYSSTVTDNPETGKIVSWIVLGFGAIIAFAALLVIRNNNKLYKI